MDTYVSLKALAPSVPPKPATLQPPALSEPWSGWRPGFPQHVGTATCDLAPLVNPGST